MGPLEEALHLVFRVHKCVSAVRIGKFFPQLFLEFKIGLVIVADLLNCLPRICVITFESFSEEFLLLVRREMLRSIILLANRVLMLVGQLTGELLTLDHYLASEDPA